MSFRVLLLGACTCIVVILLTRPTLLSFYNMLGSCNRFVLTFILFGISIVCRPSSLLVTVHMKYLFPSSSFLFKLNKLNFKYFLFIHLRERVRACARVRENEQGEGHMERDKQTLCWAGSLITRFNPRTLGS